MCFNLNKTKQYKLKQKFIVLNTFKNATTNKFNSSQKKADIQQKLIYFTYLESLKPIQV